MVVLECTPIRNFVGTVDTGAAVLALPNFNHALLDPKLETDTE
jgi:hypothetical protein